MEPFSPVFHYAEGNKSLNHLFLHTTKALLLPSQGSNSKAVCSSTPSATSVSLFVNTCCLGGDCVSEYPLRLHYQSSVSPSLCKIPPREILKPQRNPFRTRDHRIHVSPWMRVSAFLSCSFSLCSRVVNVYQSVRG